MSRDRDACRRKERCVFVVSSILSNKSRVISLKGLERGAFRTEKRR